MLRGKTVAWASLLWVPLLAACALRPAPISDAEQLARAHSDLERMFQDQEPLDAPLGFYEAVARAVRYNLEQRTRLLEQTLADRRVVGARLDLLPRLVANDEYYGRSNEPASSSQSLSTGEQSLEASISSERYGRRADLSLAWNLLDFGVSYVRAAQEANRALIARERRAKVVQDLMVDVRRAYWRAFGAERLIPQLDRLLLEVRQALDDSVSLDAEGLMDPLEALAYQRTLVSQARELGDLRRKLQVARIELAALVNARPGVPLALAPGSSDELPVPELHRPLEELEQAALSARPELREAGYEERIDRLEVRRAMLRVLPGVELRFGRNQDDNRFLVYDDWFSESLLLSKNLIEIFTAPSEIALARSGLAVGETRRLATSMTVLAQVHVAHAHFRAREDALRLAGTARRVASRSEAVAQARAAAESQSELERIQRTASRLVAEVGYGLAYADLQEAYGRVLSSVGVLPPLDEADVADLAQLTERIGEALEGWGRSASSAPLHAGPDPVADPDDDPFPPALPSTGAPPTLPAVGADLPQLESP